MLHKLIGELSSLPTVCLLVGQVLVLCHLDCMHVTLTMSCQDALLSVTDKIELSVRLLCFHVGVFSIHVTYYLGYGDEK